MNQEQFIHNYIDKNTDKFNSTLFLRSDDAIIEALKKIILSCQRDSFFKIKVEKFKVVDDFFEVNDTLRQYQDYLKNKKTSRNKDMEDNRYNFIDLKESALKLLIVTYYMEINGEHDTIDVIIAVPRVVDKFYFLLNGSYYSAMFQIVDASTYNNGTSKSKSHSVTLKTNFQPIKIFRNVNVLSTTKGEEVQVTQYDCNAFNKTVSAVMYIFAEYGYYGALEMLGISNSIIITEEDMDNDNYYTFKNKRCELFINVPKILLSNNSVIQHTVNMLANYIDSNATMDTVFTKDYWVNKLGICFNSANSHDKGLNVLMSLKGIYDINIKEEIHLPYEYKKDIFCIIRWMISEYNNLRQKDNLNIRIKKIRCSEYIAAIYAAKLSTGIYRLSDQGKRAELKSIRRVIATNPMYLVNNLAKIQLVNFRNIVTDMDSMVALKFTYKGVSGIGEKKSAIPKVYRLLDPSNMGILDPDSSSPTDPGISGSIVPLVKIYGNGYFSDFKEPLTWESEYAKLYNSYKESRGLIDVLEFKKKVLNENISDNELQLSKDSTATIENINKTVALDSMNSTNENYNGYPLEGSGIISYE